MQRSLSNVVRLREHAPPAAGPVSEPARASSTQENRPLDKQTRSARFEEIFTAHLDAAYDLAHWLTRDAQNAEDVVQEACLRALRFIDSFHGESARGWLLAIVRNTFYTWLEKNRNHALAVPFEEEQFAADGSDPNSFEGASNGNVDGLLRQEESRRLVNNALAALPPEFREVIALREMEDLSYKEIAAITNVPIGTVMSRLARARKMMLRSLQQLSQE